MNEFDTFSNSFFNGGVGKISLGSNERSENYQKFALSPKIPNSSVSTKLATSSNRPRITLRAWGKSSTSHTKS